MRWIRNLLYPVGKITALAFIFIGGGILALTILPILSVLPGQKQLRAQAVVSGLFRLYLRWLQFAHLIRMDVTGSEKFAQCSGKIVIANHPSLLDVVILMAFIPKAQCIIKHELWDHRSLGFLMRRAGYIRNDLDPQNLIEQCKASLGEGRCLIIFPEGTRTRPGTLPSFQRGFANIATLTNAPIQQVVIDCYPSFLFKTESIWRVPPATPFYKIAVLDCLDPQSYSRYGRRGVAVRKLAESLENDYGQQLRNGQSGAGT